MKIRRVHRKYPVRKFASKPCHQVNVVIKENIVPVFTDTGADISVMSFEEAKKLNLPLKRTRAKIRPYGSKTLKCTGFYDGTVMFGETVANARIYVIKKKLETLLSGRLCEELGIIEFNGAPTETKGEDLIRRANIEQNDPIAETILQHPRAFEGIGTLKDNTVHFYIDSQVPPVAQPPRPVPFHLRERFDKEIQSMEETGIIGEHHGPTPWVSNVVLSPKDDGGIWVTIDLREANRAIQATNIPISRVVIQDLSTRFPAAKIVPSTGGSHVIPEIKDIYVDFGYPDTHTTDNGPPFDSQEFNEFSRSHGIKHRKVFPYHPQANPVEILMKPLGKAMKIANYGRQSKGKALNSFLTSYRSTPHPLTGQAPGDLLFRGGYRNNFPHHTLSESQVKDAKQQDKDLRKDRQDVLNASSHWKASNFLSSDLVIVRNNQWKKFDPLFGPEIFTVIQPVSNGLLLERTRDGQIFR